MFTHGRFAIAVLALLLGPCAQPGLLRASSGESVAIEPHAAPEVTAQAELLLDQGSTVIDLAGGGWPGLTATQLLPEHSRPQFRGAVLDLPEALRLALDKHPLLAALQQEIHAAQGRAYQGSIKPNPEFEAGISDFMGTAETRFFRGAVTGFGVSQLVECGRKRYARVAVAQKEGQLVEYEIERQQLDIMLAVTEAYYAALVAQERLLLALEREALVQQVFDTVVLRVEGGKAARLDQTRAGIDLAASRLEREQAERQQTQAMARLASLWGADGTDYGSVDGALSLPGEEPELSPLLATVPSTPEMRRWAAEEELRRARRDLAQAEGASDLTWSGGLQRFEDTDSFGFNLGVSFPLQVRRSSHGKVVEAQAYIDQVEDLSAAQQRELVQQLTDAHGRMAAAYAQARAIESELLPGAMETFELTQLGYSYGKFGLLDVLDAQRTLIDIRDQYFEALADYQLAAVRVERLVAQPLSLVQAQARMEQSND